MSNKLWRLNPFSSKPAPLASLNRVDSGVREAVLRGMMKEPESYAASVAKQSVQQYVNGVEVSCACVCSSFAWC
jgi:hypothetical protein